MRPTRRRACGRSTFRKAGDRRRSRLRLWAWSPGLRRWRSARQPWSPPVLRRRSHPRMAHAQPPKRRRRRQLRPSSVACSRSSRSRARSGLRSREHPGSSSPSEAAVAQRSSFEGWSVPKSGVRIARGSSRLVPHRPEPRSSWGSSEPCSSRGTSVRKRASSSRRLGRLHDSDRTASSRFDASAL